MCLYDFPVTPYFGANRKRLSSGYLLMQIHETYRTSWFRFFNPSVRVGVEITRIMAEDSLFRIFPLQTKRIFFCSQDMQLAISAIAKERPTVEYSAPDAWDRFSRQTFFLHFYTSTHFLLALWKDLTELNQE